MTNSRHSRRRFLSLILIASLIVLSSAATASAFLDPGSIAIVQTLWQVNGINEKSKYEYYFQEILQLKNQLFQLKSMETELSRGWKDPLQILSDDRSRTIAIGLDLKTIGWQSPNQIATSTVLQRAEEAHRLLNSAAEGTEQPTGNQLRVSLEDLYEVSNATRTGGRSEAAIQDIAATVTFMGQLNQQLQEQHKIYDEAYNKVQQGDLAQTDVQRLGVVMQTAQGRQQVLDTQLKMLTAKMQMDQLGLQVAQGNQQDRQMFDERANRLSSMHAIQLAPGLPTVGELSRGPSNQ